MAREGFGGSARVITLSDTIALLPEHVGQPHELGCRVALTGPTLQGPRSVDWPAQLLAERGWRHRPWLGGEAGGIMDWGYSRAGGLCLLHTEWTGPDDDDTTGTIVPITTLVVLCVADRAMPTSLRDVYDEGS